MIIKGPAADSFAKQPNPDAKAVLIYGADEGQIQNLSKQLKQSIIGDDELCYTELSGDEVLKEPAQLMDAIMSPSLLGGRRLVRVRNVNHNHIKLIKDVLENGFSPQEVVLLIDSNATKKGLLQKLFEDPRKDLVSIPCYIEEGHNKVRQLNILLKEKNLTLNNECLKYLEEVLPSDSQLAVTEIEKLSLYAGDKTTLTLSEIEQCCTGLYQANFDDFSYGILEGDITHVVNTTKQLESEGIPAIVLVRAALNLVQQLLKAQSSQQPAALAVNSLRPPIFFKLKPRFMALMQQWRFDALQQAFDCLLTLENRLKTTESDKVFTTVGQASLSIKHLRRP